jgi:hypothetical protein
MCKSIQFTLFFLQIIPFWTFAQTQPTGGQTQPAVIDLYVSKQTGQYSIFAGSKSKTTDQWEHGSVSISTSGPVLYRVDPNDFSIGTNETKTWYGMVWGDVANAPAPGENIAASITGNYNVTYSRPAQNSTGHEIVNKVSSETVNFMVHSVNVTMVDSIMVCPNVDQVLYANGSPDGGTYSWTSAGNVTITAGANTQSPTIRCNATGNGTATVTYTVQGVSYRATTTVVCVNPSLTLSCPDTLRVGINQRFNIRATLTPRGGVPRWTVTNGLTLNSGPYGIVAFLTASAGGWQTITATATICGRAITKTVRVYVNPCMLYLEDSIVICLNNNTTITASANVNGGTYSWTAGNNVNIQAGANAATVTIRGTAATSNGWAEVRFQTTDCDIRKRVKIIVVARPTLRIYATFGNLSSMCKGERRILNASAQPSGGTISWSLSSNSLKWYGAVGANNWNPVVEADRGGPCTITCTYTVCGQTVTATQDVYVNQYSRIDIASSVNGSDINSGTRVTYTATVYDFAGRVANPQPTLHWKVVYIPVGQDRNVGNWVSYDLQGGGTTQTYTWSFPQGNNPLPGGGGPYSMRAWIEASEYCTYHSGSVHINVISQNGRN